jgi:hypothetical protein
MLSDPRTNREQSKRSLGSRPPRPRAASAGKAVLSSTMRCDSHVLIVGPAETYPQALQRTCLAPPAPLPSLDLAEATLADNPARLYDFAS